MQKFISFEASNWMHSTLDFTKKNHLDGYAKEPFVIEYEDENTHKFTSRKCEVGELVSIDHTLNEKDWKKTIPALTPNDVIKFFDEVFPIIKIIPATTEYTKHYYKVAVCSGAIVTYESKTNENPLIAMNDMLCDEEFRAIVLSRMPK